jgi:BirA family transcriptional regulator, biotin operon repressor / biotin---[acetyl-CoA-carboxylase] ligase
MNRALALLALRRLADGQWHSGEAMGTALGVTRATISNAIKDLDEAGIVIERAHGRGYRLVSPFEPLCPATIAAAYGNAAVWRGSPAPTLSLTCADTVESTNTVLAAQDPCPVNGHILTCEWQTHGRGRRGRNWLAPPGGALTFSMRWRFATGAASLSGLSLAVSVALVDALTEAGLAPDHLQVKWPNDVLCDGGKLAGILLEATGDMLGPSDVIIGIGVNHALPEHLHAQIGQRVADVVSGFAGQNAPSRNVLFGLLLAHLRVTIETFARDGFAAFRQRWLAAHAHAGKRVKVRDGNEVMVGKALGVDAQGALMLDVNGRTRVLSAAEVLYE